MACYERLKEKLVDEGHNRPNLGDFLAEFGGGKHVLRAVRTDGTLTYTTPDTSIERYQVGILRDKLSDLEYAFLDLPIAYLHHDDRINPRAVGPRIRELIREFLNGRPQLHVALAWGILENGNLQVYIFDGQHKAVAQILLGVRVLPVRLFIDPNLNLLLETNTRAGTTLRQVAFDQATQRFLGSQLYWEKIDEFRQATGRAPDSLAFSEQDLVNYFKGERREVTRYILDDVRTAVIHHPDNKLRDFVEFSGRQADKPISYSAIERTVFSVFIRKRPMPVPMNYKLEIGENPRELEKEQIVRLLNLFSDRVYSGAYDFDIGSRRIEEKVRQGENIPDDHLRAIRIAREEVLYNLLRYVRDLIKQYFLMQGQVIEDDELFQRKFSKELWSLVDKLIVSLANLPLWVDRQMSSTVFGAKQSREYWKLVFETGLNPDGVPVLAKALNLNDLVR